MSMEITFECTQCGAAYRVLRLDEDLSLLNLQMPCPKDGCSGPFQIVQKTRTGELPERVSAKHLYQACMGRGFPEERKCSPEALEKLMVGKLISGMKLEASKSDEDRSIIVGMDLAVPGSECTFAVYFGVSTRGATIYKVIEVEKNVRRNGS